MAVVNYALWPLQAQRGKVLWLQQESRESRAAMHEGMVEVADSLVQLFLNDNSWQERAKRTANLIQDILLIFGNEVVE